MEDVNIITLGGGEITFINNMCRWLRPLKAVCMLCDYAILKIPSSQMYFQLPNERKKSLLYSTRNWIKMHDEKHGQTCLRLCPFILRGVFDWLLSAVICCLQCEDKWCGLLAWTTMAFYKWSTEFQLKREYFSKHEKSFIHFLKRDVINTERDFAATWRSEPQQDKRRLSYWLAIDDATSTHAEVKLRTLPVTFAFDSSDSI